MKRLLFIIPAFNHGGTNRSLLNIMSCLNEDEYSIDIYALSHEGPYKQIFDSSRVLSRDIRLSSIFESYKFIKSQTSGDKLKKLILKSIYRSLKNVLGEKVKQWVFAGAAKKISRMNYDTVIAMQEGLVTNFVSCIKGYKVTWIHCDYDEYSAIVNEDEGRIYAQFNQIICVSQYTRQVFVEHYPSLADKCHAVHNMLHSETIINMANDTRALDVRFNPGQFCIVSIGRLSPVKQFDIIPSLAARLRADGCQFHWYIIGEGEEKAHIVEMIQKHQVSDIVVLLGEKDNPYPYIKAADLLVCTSASEACPLVINEARILHVPVVSTDFGSASEFVEEGYNGLIASRENIQDAITDMIRNQAAYQKIKSNISSFTYSNDRIIDDICRLL